MQDAGSLSRRLVVLKIELQIGKRWVCQGLPPPPFFLFFNDQLHSDPGLKRITLSIAGLNHLGRSE